MNPFYPNQQSLSYEKSFFINAMAIRLTNQIIDTDLVNDPSLDALLTAVKDYLIECIYDMGLVLDDGWDRDLNDLYSELRDGDFHLYFYREILSKYDSVGAAAIALELLDVEQFNVIRAYLSH